MSTVGIGYRRAWDLSVEISFHLLEPICLTTLESNISAGTQEADVGSLASIFVGCQLVVDTGAGQEAVTVTATYSPGSPPTYPAIGATFTKAHSAGARIIAATFPVQAITDPIYTQAEILSYIARAQNQFLFDCPCSYQLTQQAVNYGQLIQSAPANMIEMERVSCANNATGLTTLTRASNVVTAATIFPHRLSVGSRFTVFGVAANGWNGIFKVLSVISPTSFTYAQTGGNASTTGGSVGTFTRLYENSQEDLTMARGTAWSNQHVSSLNSWWEDRSGLYQWGVDGIPANNFTVNILSSQRDSDTLALLDGFLVPDLFLHIIKYKALNYCWSKEGEANSPLMASYAEMRYQRGLAAVRRWMGAMGMNTGDSGAAGVSAALAALTGRKGSGQR